MAVGLAPKLFVLVVSMTAVQSQIQKGPVNSLNKIGDSVTLKCVTSSNNCDRVEWSKVEGLQSPKPIYRNGYGMLNSDVYPTQRYSVNSTGGCSLTITQLVIGDSGKFMCKQDVGDGEETKTAILVVIDVTESCLSNVTSNELTEGDGYSFWSVIRVPPKSVEPSDVSLFFHNKIGDETETTDKNQTHTVNTTLTGIMTKKNITWRGCRASFPPHADPNYDRTTAILDICSTTELIVSYPVENFAVSPLSGPYYKDNTVRCTADGHPPPTIKWTHSKSGTVLDGDTLVIKGNAGDEYTCTATNTVKGKETSQRKTIEVSPDPNCADGCIVAIIICVFGGCIIIVVVYFAGVRCELWSLSPCCRPLVDYWNNCICCIICICPIKDKKKKDERANALLPTSTTAGPEKPPRHSDNPVKPEAV